MQAMLLREKNVGAGARGLCGWLRSTGASMGVETCSGEAKEWRSVAMHGLCVHATH